MLAEKLRDASPGTSTPRSPNTRTPPSGGCLNAADISEEPEDGYDGSPYKGSSYGSYAATAPLPPKNGQSPTTMMPTIIPAPRPASWASSPSSGGGSLASRSPSMKASVAMKDRRPVARHTTACYDLDPAAGSLGRGRVGAVDSREAAANNAARADLECMAQLHASAGAYGRSLLRAAA